MFGEVFMTKSLGASKPIEKIDDDCLECSAGVTLTYKGKTIEITPLDAVAHLAGPAFCAGWGCQIASCVYFSKANKAKKNNDIAGYDKYIGKAQRCGIAAASVTGAFIGALVISNMYGEKNKNKGL